MQEKLPGKSQSSKTESGCSQTGNSQNYFKFFSIVISLIFGLTIAEWALRYQRQSVEESIRKSESMAPGMILYDANLGWKLNPDWSGKHQHYDFDASYSINSDGFRGLNSKSGEYDYMVVGDSFSFGLGVDDNETFTALLNQESSIYSFNNYSVPGYSTDQQLLLIRDLMDNKKSSVLLIVYLGNDIFDNTRAFPLQAEHGKPYFVRDGDLLVLKNTPVPLMSKPAAVRQESLATVVLGDSSEVDNDVAGNIFSWFKGLELSSRVGVHAESAILNDSFMNQRFTDSLLLFNLLLSKINEIVDHNHGQLSVVLLPGRSYVEQPDSASAQYQEYFRQNITESVQQSEGIDLMDLATYLRALNNKGITGLYFPNEGHLTPAGHQRVAEYLMHQIKNQKNNHK